VNKAIHNIETAHLTPARALPQVADVIPDVVGQPHDWLGAGVAAVFAVADVTALATDVSGYPFLITYWAPACAAS
jgi:hypothetical protein